jgi:Ala-tRNA(Pro) deacylase
MNERLRELLARERAAFELVGHAEVYTAQERAASCHVSGHRLAKTVIVRDGDWVAMTVVPASAYVDLARLRQVTGRRDLGLANERDFARLFPDCDTGAMPPFGELYGLPVYLDRSLAEGSELVVEAGTHREELRIPTADYLRVARPVVDAFAATPRAA